MAAAERALELNPELPTALHAMANNLHFQFKWAEADEYFQRAILLDPDSTDIMEDYSHFLHYSWQYDKARVVADRMIKLDPLVPIFRFAASHSAEALGDFETRNEHIRIGLEVNPGFPTLQQLNFERLLEDKQFAAAREYTGRMNLPYPATLEGTRRLINWLADPSESLDREMLDALQVYPKIALFAGQYQLWTDTVWTLEFIDPETALIYMTVLSPHRSKPWYEELIRLPENREMIANSRLPQYWRQIGWPERCRPVGEEDFECD